jgi:hypothetical protein
MNPPDLHACALALIDAVLNLVGTSRSDPRYGEAFDRVLRLCKSYLTASHDACARAPAASTPTALKSDLDLGRRIAELAATGMGVRAIAKRLSCAPSTVSRRLRRA